MSRKIIVAVHGIGDQVEFATIQSVANRVYDYCDPSSPFTIPLGRFHSALKNDDGTRGGEGAYFPHHPDPAIPDPGKPSSEIGFTEVYWADICRKPAREGYTLEEAQLWVKTMVNRIRRFDAETTQAKREHKQENLPTPRRIDYDRIELVLNEAIETVNVAERLASLLAKMNLIKPIQLRAVLNDFLGDVQFVAEFVPFRNRILGRFNETLEAISLQKGDEIYFVAHSEGTVVTFLGLLTALEEPKPAAWTKHVRGLMTIGSPIDKHLILWPDIWPLKKNEVDREPRITWWNYFDKGDPVGYELDSTVKWMKCHGWDKVFDLSPKTECGFTRYLLPGQAHNDYWMDVELFDHFLADVVVPTPPPNRPSKSKPAPPKTKHVAQVVSYILPYVLFGLLLLAATYLLNKGVTNFLAPPDPPPRPVSQTIAHVVGLSFLLAGVTVLARIPRLTRRTTWHGVALLVFLLTSGLFIFFHMVSPESLKPYLEALQESPRMPPFIKKLDDLGFAVGGVILGSFVALIAYSISVMRPAWRMKPLIVVGGLVLFAFIAARISLVAVPIEQPLWPLVLSFLAFCYLWWMAALCFDLTFIWHLYVRWSVADAGLRGRQWKHLRDME